MSNVTERLIFASNMTELEKASADAIDEIARLNTQLQTHIVANLSLDREVEKLRSELSKHTTALQKRDAEIEQLQDQLQIKAGHLLDAEQTVKQREEEIEKLNAYLRGWIEQHKVLLAKLHTSNSENERLQQKFTDS